MNRFKLTLSLAASFFIGSLMLNGCKAPTLDYQISQFATIRVMNFAPNCTSPMDIYWWPQGQTRQTQANVYNLPYGGASVYSNLLPATMDNVLVTPHLILTESDLSTTINVPPPSSATTGKYTLVITRLNTGVFKDTLIQDGVQNPSQSMTYVRFMNLQSGVGPLTVHVNDPVTGDLINSVADTFGMISGYTALQSANDTSYAFLVTNSKNQIIARVSDQTFIGGSCYTLVYAGDLCSTLAENPADSTQSADDTLRLRAFDDNSLGNDQTNPVTPSFRYNIVNDIIPVTDVYDPAHPEDTTIGFLVNGEAFTGFHGYSVPPVPVYQAAGENINPPLNNGALDVTYQSSIIPTTMVVQGFATNAAGSYQQEIFNAGSIVAYPLRETAFFNSDTNNNRTWTMLFDDVFPSPTQYPSHLDTDLGLSSHFSLIQVPDMSSPNEVIVEFIAGVVANAPNTSNTTNESLFYLQPQGDTVIPSPGNAGKGMVTGSSRIIEFPMTSPTPISVIDSIGTGTSSANVRVFGNSTSFTAQPGGIYEIISEGIKTNPQLLIVHVNP